MEWHHRGERYSLPKAVSGSASGKNLKGGRKGAWGHNLVLAEDQKEDQRALNQKSVKAKDLMDEDYLPRILTGERGRAGGRPKVGAGRDINATKRKK